MTHPGSARSRTYIPTLDGWRAIAILLVIGTHCRPALLNADTPVSKFLATIAMHSAYGVDVFFALSGFLICTLLLREQSRSSRIDLGGFYIRRAFRILPPILAYLAVLVGLKWSGALPDISGTQIFSVLTFVRNYFPTEGSWWYTDHFWSLAIEEHFYLVIPCLLAFLRWRVALPAMFGIAVTSAIIRAVESQYLGASDVPVMFRTESRLDALMYGAVLAVVLERSGQRAAIGRWLSLRFLGPALVLASAIVLLAPSGSLRRTVIAIALPLCIVSTVLAPDSLLGRVLEWPALRWVGRLSYSLYIWQMLFLVRDDRPLGWLQTFPQALGLALIASVISYYGIERPMLRIGHYLSGNRPAPSNSEQEEEAVEQFSTMTAGTSSPG